jgi:hypothetical protein
MTILFSFCDKMATLGVIPFPGENISHIVTHRSASTSIRVGYQESKVPDHFICGRSLNVVSGMCQN